MKPVVVLDTNVLVSALSSKLGASHRLFQLVGTDKFTTALSVPLVLEYESVIKRRKKLHKLTAKQVADIIDYLCSASIKQKVFYLWRPFLPDPKDDMILELAIAAACNYIITFNKRDFSGVDHFNIKIATPGEFLKIIGEIK